MWGEGCTPWPRGVMWHRGPCAWPRGAPFLPSGHPLQSCKMRQRVTRPPALDCSVQKSKVIQTSLPLVLGRLGPVASPSVGAGRWRLPRSLQAHTGPQDVLPLGGSSSFPPPGTSALGSLLPFPPLESRAVDAYFLYPSMWLEAGLWSRRLCLLSSNWSSP